MANVFEGRTYARTWMTILGIGLLLTALLGLFPPAVEAFHGLRSHLEGGENAVHWVLGLGALALAFSVRNPRVLALVSIVLGVVFLAVAVLGAFVPIVGPWHVDVADNWLHALLGVLSIGAGVASRPDARTRIRRRPAY